MGWGCDIGRSGTLILAALFVSGCVMTQQAKNQATYHFQMGLSYLGENNYTSALVELTEAEKIDPNDPDILHRLGQAYYFKKKFDLAAEMYRRALARRPAFSQARNDLGVAYMELKRWDDAIRELRLVSEDLFYPGQAEGGVNLALAYMGKGDTENALSTIRPLVSLYPGNPLVRLTMGRVYFAAGKTGLALDEFREAIKILPDYAMAHYYLGVALLKTGDSRGARVAFEEVVRIAPYSEIGVLAKEHIDSLN